MSQSQTTSCTRPGDVAQQLLRALDRLALELDAAPITPTGAFELLGPGMLGWTERVYCDEAFAAWQQLLAANPDDHATLHHMAILYHARAFDREFGDTPSQANSDWERGLEYWYRLWQSDDFWKLQAEQLSNYEDGAAITKELRRTLPEKLLRIHGDIALDPETRAQRVRFHIRMLRAAPFDEECKSRLLAEIYDSHMREVPAEVWSDSVTDPQQLRQGTDPLEQYLELDPESVAALTDALRLQIRMLRGWYGELNLLPDQATAERQGLLERIRATAEYWDGHFQRLIARVEVLSPEARDELALWFRVAGQVSLELGRTRSAINQYHTALRVGADDDSERRRCHNGLLQSQAVMAREKALAGHEDALEECRVLQRVGELSLGTRHVLANAFLILGEYDTAEAVCQIGLDQSPVPFDADVDAFHEHQDNLRHLLVSINRARRQHHHAPELNAARQALQSGDWNGALRCLDGVLQSCPDDMVALILRCRCHLELFDLPAAENDFEACRKLLDHDKSANDLIVKLRQEISQSREDAARMGDAAARLQNAARVSMNRTNLAEAEQLLRQAILVSYPAGRGELQTDLARVLRERAMRTATSVLDDPKASSMERLDACRRAVDVYREATLLDPQLRQSSQEIDSLRELVTHFETEVEADKQAAKLLKEFGSTEALQWHQDAIRAWNADHRHEALRLMRRAGAKAPDSHRIRQSLSQMLDSSAVAMVNEMHEFNENVIQQACDLLAEAAQLDPDSQTIRDHLATVKDMI